MLHGVPGTDPTPHPCAQATSTVDQAGPQPSPRQLNSQQEFYARYCGCSPFADRTPQVANGGQGVGMFPGKSINHLSELWHRLISSDPQTPSQARRAAAPLTIRSKQ